MLIKLSQSLAAILMITFLSCPVTKGQDQAETKELPLSTKQDINAYTHLDRSANNTNNVFVLGDSLFQKQEQERELKRRAEIKESPGFSTGDAKRLYPDNTNNCTVWAKRQAGIGGVLGAGGRRAVNSQEPKVGAIGVEREIIHAVLITKIDGDMITFSESNFIKNWITERTLPRSEFLGFII
jgi:hypothetical protein